MTLEEALAKLPPGRNQVCSFGVKVVEPGEIIEASIELQQPFLLEYILMGPHEVLDGLQVLDLTSGGRSLFISRLPYSAPCFGSKGWGPSFGSTITQICEQLVLKVSNTSTVAKKFSVAAVGKCFPEQSVGGNGSTVHQVRHMPGEEKDLEWLIRID